MIDCFFQSRDVLTEMGHIERILDRYPATDPADLARQDSELRSSGAHAFSIVGHARDACFAPERRDAFVALATYLDGAGSVPIDVDRVRALMHATGIDICVLLESCVRPTPAGS